MTAPSAWVQPLFASPPSGPVPRVVIDGTALEGDFRSFSASLEEQGVFVENVGGQGIPHVFLPGIGAPATLGPWEGELDLFLDSEESARLLMLAPALARVGLLTFWLDSWIPDLWIGNGTRTVFGMSRSTGYGSTGVAWADRPARCFVGATELDMVTAAPSAGECQLSQTVDSTSIVLGSAPASGARVVLLYYPVRVGAAGVDLEYSDFNDGAITLSFRETIPPRAYAT